MGALARDCGLEIIVAPHPFDGEVANRGAPSDVFVISAKTAWAF